jgi:mannose-6-phosphate isomerase-like protein (cupin superfamily)
MTTINSVGTIKKGWGQERIWASNEWYCGKFLEFNAGAQFSMHFHRNKIETWYCLSGKFEIEWLDTKDASLHSERFLPGNTWTNETLEPHRIICIEEGVIIEVSTYDDPEDNYRVQKGDSQKEKYN